MPLTTSVLYDDAVTLVALDGELDLSVGPQLDAVVDGVLADGRRLLLVDLGALRFCDSSGLGALLRANRVVSEAGGSLVVAGASGAVQRLLVLTSMSKLLRIETDVQPALVRLRRSASETPSGG